MSGVRVTWSWGVVVCVMLGWAGVGDGQAGVAATGSGASATTAATVPMTTEFVQRFKRFYQIKNVGMELNASDKAAAQKMAGVIRQHIKENPELAGILAHYLARSEAVAGNVAEAKALALPVAQDKTDPNCADARDLLHALGFRSTGTAVDRKDPLLVELMDASYSEIAEIYPFGTEADGKLRNDSTLIQGGLGPMDAPRPFVYDYRETISAAGKYSEMNMYKDAVDTYRLSIGLTDADTWIHSGARPEWMAMGDCFAALGAWKQALAHYFKAMACGQPLADITHRIDEAQAGMKEKKVVKPAEPKPDAAALEQIATLLAETALFDQAIAAAEAANKVRKVEGSELLRSIHAKKANTLEFVMGRYGEGLVYRGTKLTKENVAKEKELAKGR